MPNRRKENPGLFFDERKNILDAFSSSIFPFKITDTHSDYLERALTQDSLKITPIIASNREYTTYA